MGKYALRAFAAFGLLALISACSGPPPKPLKVGWFGPLSGDQAANGEPELNTVKMLFEEYNAKGGIEIGGKRYLLEVESYDNKSDPNTATTIAKRLARDAGVVAILGPDTSASAIPIAPILEQYKVPGIATVATNPRVTVHEGRVKPYNFRVCFIDPYQGAVAAGYAYDVLKLRTAAIVTQQFDEYSEGLADFFSDSFRTKGGAILARESFKPGTTDFGKLLEPILRAKPDVVFLPYLYSEVTMTVIQARKMGITATFMGGDGWPSLELVKSGGQAIEGSYFVNHLDYDDPEVQDYARRYRDLYGKDTEINGYLVHDAVLMLVDALKRAGKVDGEALKEALEKTDMKGITGHIRISAATHNPEGKDAAVIKIENRKYVFQQKYAVN